MKEDNNKRPVKTRGRKRDESRTDSILQATIGLLLEVGFDKFRVQDVAERAGSGTGAIYRRWPKKEALIAEAIRNMPVTKVNSTDDPIVDLRALINSQCISAFKKPDLVPGLIAAMRGDTGIEEAVKAGYSLEHYRSAIARIIGDEHPQLDLLTDLTPAMTLYRASFTPEKIEPEEMTDKIVSLILSFAKQP
ncbi:MAG: TetR/AcrR family transcriptional regulator [Pseudomonadales bacterium]|nr:TetR/AcrR family transcriptional regulator [Pseudomonadales bacterium]